VCATADDGIILSFLQTAGQRKEASKWMEWPSTVHVNYQNVQCASLGDKDSIQFGELARVFLFSLQLVILFLFSPEDAYHVLFHSFIHSCIFLSARKGVRTETHLLFMLLLLQYQRRLALEPTELAPPVVVSYTFDSPRTKTLRVGAWVSLVP
jgi:hypothetical protein